MTEFELITFQKENSPRGQFVRHDLEGLSIWVKVYERNSLAFYDECAHMGGDLTFSQLFTCKTHGWSYSESGTNLNTGSPGLRKVQIVTEDAESIVFRVKAKLQQKRGSLNHELKISVLSHACLLLEYKGTRVLFDPWLYGTAYYGSWELFPNLNIDVRKLVVDAIVITHPHPDHFHIQTLNEMQKDTPVYFPGFPSKLIENGLSEIGWRDLNPQTWGCEFSVGENTRIRFVRPRSFWEDSATLVTVYEDETVFTWLNMVDAGSVIDEHSLPNLDLLTSAFDQGASGFPLTWKHLTQKNQVAILEEQQRQTLINLPKKAKQLKARNFLPFAGHWRLAMPEHQKFAELIPHTNFDQLSLSFQQLAPDVNFLSLMPGDSFDFFTGSSREFSLEKKSKSKQSINSDHQMRAEISDEERKSFESFMHSLASYSEVFNCESVILAVSVSGYDYRAPFNFGAYSDSPIKIEVEIPRDIFHLLAQKKANWDHVAIGYWGTWTRTPNRYPANFMRLLQAGSPEKYESKAKLTGSLSRELLETSIADLIERDPWEVPGLLTRVGLPCGACSLINTETLEQALNLHDVDLTANEWFSRELTSLLARSGK